MLNLSDPLGIVSFWTRTGVAMAEASMATTFDAMATCCTQMSTALETTADVLQRPMPATGLAAGPALGPTATVTRLSPVAARRETTRSWYRAPYRSPFDPAFWLTPGADWDPLMRIMGPFHPLAVRPPHDTSATLLPFVGLMLAARPAMPPASLRPETARFQPWAVPWLAVDWLEWYSNLASRNALPPPANDHPPPRATYRTDGGHAAGTVTWLPVGTAASRSAPRDPEPRPAIGDWPFLFAPWLRR